MIFFIIFSVSGASLCYPRTSKKHSNRQAECGSQVSHSESLTENILYG
jgi:hypothetical protein